MTSLALATTVSRELDPAVNARYLRRLDWRFLLSNPELRRVGYLGRPDPTLMRALETYAESLSLVADPPGPGALDVLVAKSASPAAICAAAGRLVPGGWLYWELGPFDSWRSRRLPFRDLGLTAASVHWHYRGFGDCRWIVSLDDADGLAALIARQYADLPAGWAARFSRVIATSRMLRRAMSTSVIARRGDS
jgi:hypothetical protein